MVRHGSIDIPEFEITLAGLPPEPLYVKETMHKAVMILLSRNLLRPDRDRLERERDKLVREIRDLTEKK